MASAIDVPEKLVKWKHKFDIGNLDEQQNAKAAKLADAVATLINDLRRDPRFELDVVLGKFKGYAKTWEDANGILNDPTQQLKNLRQALSDLEDLRLTLIQKFSVADTVGMSQDIQRLMNSCQSLQLQIEGKLRPDKRRQQDDKASQRFADRLDALVDETARVQGELEKMRLTSIRWEVLRGEQQSFLTSLTNESYFARARADLRSEADDVLNRAYRMLSCAEKDPNRDRKALGEVTANYDILRVEIERELADDHLQSFKFVRAKLSEVERLEDEVYAKMGNQTLVALSRDDAKTIEKRTEEFHAAYLKAIEGCRRDIARIAAVSANFDSSGLEKSLLEVADENNEARRQTLEKVAEMLKDSSVSSPWEFMASSFNSVRDNVDKVRIEIDEKLAGADERALKMQDIQPFYDKALAVPADLKIPGRDTIESKYKLAVATGTNHFKALDLFDEVKELAVEIDYAYRQHDSAYWDKKTKADGKLARRTTQVGRRIKAVKTDKQPFSKSERKAAEAKLNEARLLIARDEVRDFDAAIAILDALKKDLNEGKTTQDEKERKAKFDLAMLELQPYFDAAMKLPPDVHGSLKTEYDLIGRDAAPDYGKLIHKRIGELKQQCIDAIRQPYNDWEEKLREAKVSVAAMRRVLNTNDEGTQEWKDARNAVNDYDKGVVDAAHGDYPTAIGLVDNAITKATTLLQSFKQQRKQLHSELDAQEKELHWTGPGKEFETSNRSNVADFDQRKGFEAKFLKSDQLKQMEHVFHVKQEAFDKLCKMGENPLKICHDVFKGIPESFWPPRAMKIVAAFRAAEAEFEEEALREEAKSLLKAPEQFKDVNDLRKAVEAAKEAGDKAKDETKSGLLKIEGVTENVVGELAGWVSSIAKLADENMLDNDPLGITGDVSASVGTVLSGIATVKDAVTAINMLRKASAEKKRADVKARGEDVSKGLVKVKILEFERNRALVHFANHATDAVLSGLGFVSKGAPVAGPLVGLVQNSKRLALALYEAGRYADMMGASLAYEQLSASDPESIVHLGLARQWKEEGLGSGRKCFQCAMALLGMSGNVIELGGEASVIAAAPGKIAGFAIDATKNVLTFGEKTIFTVGSWIEAERQVKKIKKARQQPPNYKAIAEVFSDTRKYARYLLAWGCVEDNDPWARAWVKGRGLSDRDLDDPNTSTQIIREYINVTQEGKLGDKQDEDPGRFGDTLIARAGKQIGKAGKWVGRPVLDAVLERDRGIGTDWFEIKLETDFVKNLNENQWKSHLERAVQNGLFHGSHVKDLKKYFESVEQAFVDFSLLKDSKSSGNATKDEQFQKAADGLYKALDALREAISAYDPVGNHKRPHKCMEVYLLKLFEEIGKAKDDLATRREAYIQSIYLHNANGDKQRAKTLRDQALQDAVNADESKRVAIDDARRDVTVELFKSRKFKTPYGTYTVGADVYATMASDAAKTLTGAKEKDLKDDIEQICNVVCVRITDNLRGAVGAVAGNPAEKPFKSDYEKAFNRECDRLAPALYSKLESKFAEYVEGLNWNNDGTVATPIDNLNDSKAMRTTAVDAWKRIVQDATVDQWANGKNKVKETLGKFVEVNDMLQVELDALSNNVDLIGKWRIACADLVRALESLPVLTTHQTPHPGMVDMRKRMLDELKKHKREMDQIIAQVANRTEWDPDVTFFETYRRAFGEKAFKHLEGVAAKKYYYDKKSTPSSLVKALKEYDKLLDDWSKKRVSAEEFGDEACRAAKQAVLRFLDQLKKEFDHYLPKQHKPTPGAEHKGMAKYRQHVLQHVIRETKKRVQDEYDALLFWTKESLKLFNEKPIEWEAGCTADPPLSRSSWVTVRDSAKEFGFHVPRAKIKKGFEKLEQAEDELKLGHTTNSKVIERIDDLLEQVKDRWGEPRFEKSSKWGENAGEPHPGMCEYRDALIDKLNNRKTELEI